ncbi:hypothetical protein IJG78_02785 [Candidatus Saccharibacteria bacterium]|nr:hypothetical protein [Candidatus Saccharibacteria bacterium]
MRERLYTAYEEAARHKRGTEDEVKFEAHLYENLELLFIEIKNRTYTPSSGIAFVTMSPVIREIFAAPFRDRVVHHLLYDMMVPWLDKRLIEDAYSCRKGKGTLYGIMRMEKKMRQCSRNFSKKIYVAKFDIQGYFMSMMRPKLFEKVVWVLDKQYPRKNYIYHTLKFLWHQIIFDDPTREVRRRGAYWKWEVLPRSKSLFHQPAERGIVIGNLSSQLLSNLFLDEFDRFVKFDLGYKYYGRYVDDFFIIVTEEELSRLKREVKMIELKLSSMGLVLHPKKRTIQDAEKGVDFLGARVYPRRIIPGKRIRRNFYYYIQRLQSGMTGDLEPMISYMGLMKHLNSDKQIAKIFRLFGLDYRF